jgi:Flp pilus assembly pilin Flp
MLNRVALRLLIAWQGIGARVDDEDGQTLSEYGLIISLIAVAAVVVGVVVFRQALGDAFNRVSPCLGGSC